MLSLHSVELLVRTLFPDSPPSSSSTNSIYGTDSTESSIAGSSTLTTGSMEPGSGMVSSTTPSVSGTSMTSTTMLSEGPFVGPQVKEAGFPLAQSIDCTGKEGTSNEPQRYPFSGRVGIRLHFCERREAFIGAL